MKSSALLRQQIEVTLREKNPSALSPRLRPELPRIACGMPAVDALLHGGLPLGVIAEFVGPECSGRTTMALTYTAALVQTGSVCAWIDVADSFDPEAAAANGVDLECLLWVRCNSQQKAPQQSSSEAAIATSTNFSLGAPEGKRLGHMGGGSPHPRSEGRDMPQAITSMLQAHGGLYDRQLRREKKMIGTPGMPNRKLTWRSEDREEQVNSDRLPPRRGENLAITPRCAEPQPRRVLQLSTAKPVLAAAPAPIQAKAFAASSKQWQALDQALRATDLLLQNGGFSAIVLDLGSTAAEFVWRIPLATWFRFRAACERTRATLILLTQHPCARSSAELTLRLQAGSIESANTVMTGISYQAEVERSRSHERTARVVSIRKPPQSERTGYETVVGTARLHGSRRRIEPTLRLPLCAGVSRAGTFAPTS